MRRMSAIGALVPGPEPMVCDRSAALPGTFHARLYDTAGFHIKFAGQAIPGDFVCKRRLSIQRVYNVSMSYSLIPLFTTPIF
jgi:hypothetical protein